MVLLKKMKNSLQKVLRVLNLLTCQDTLVKEANKLRKGVFIQQNICNISKQRIENKFYLSIEHKNIRCTNNEYNLVDTSKV